MSYKYGDLIRETETGKIAEILQGDYHSPVYLMEFKHGGRYQVRAAELSKKFTKIHAICPKCGQKMQKSDLEEYAFLCHECDENFYSIEVREYR